MPYLLNTITILQVQLFPLYSLLLIRSIHCVFLILYPLNSYSACSIHLLITFYLIYSRLSRVNPFLESTSFFSLSFTYSHLSTHICKFIFLFFPFVTLSYLLHTSLTPHFLLILTPNISVLSHHFIKKRILQRTDHIFV